MKDLTKLRAQHVALGEQIRTLADKDTLTKQEEERFDLSLTEYKRLTAEIDLATSAARSALRNDPDVTSSPGWDGPAPAQWRQSDRRSAWESTARAPSQRVGNALRGIELACDMAEKYTGQRADIAPTVRSTWRSIRELRTRSRLGPTPRMHPALPSCSRSGTLDARLCR